MSQKQQGHKGENWVCTVPGTVVCSSDTFQFAGLAEQLGLSLLSGKTLSCHINQITVDSRAVKSGGLFIAMAGSGVDGHDYIEQAIASDCAAIVVEKGRIDSSQFQNRTICVFETTSTREMYCQLAEEIFGYPARGMDMFGITGTNGKTSVSYLLESILHAAGKQPGILGTINYRYYSSHDELIQIPSSFTTPEPLLLQSILREMADSGVDSVVMEVSSHGLDQQRIGNLLFDVAGFTNLSRDHLDYHLDMENYFTAKSLLFSKHLRQGGRAVVCHSAEENSWSRKLQDSLEKSGVSLLNCGQEDHYDIFPLSVKSSLRKTELLLQTQDGSCSIKSPLVGEFNVANLQTACGMAMASGIAVKTIEAALSSAAGAPGRMQQIQVNKSERAFCPAVFVDYAHTPDALEQVLKTVKGLPHGTLYCVFGCGGDRDTGKRPLMGAVAEKYADVFILTDDNPRSEDSTKILADIVPGIEMPPCEPSWLQQRKSDERGFVIIPDRHRAILAAISSAGSDDIVLIAGKGHEDYQITRDGKKFFDDTLEALQALYGWKIESLIQATAGECIGQYNTATPLGGVQTDSRTIKAGDIFVALTGERFDAHDYVEQVVEAGAGCLILERKPESAVSVPVILVADAERALGDLAHYRRQSMKSLFAPMVAGITGSSGKTTVKEMCSAIFKQRWPEQSDAPSARVLKTEGNFNNLIGLPLSLLPILPKHRAVILEMGMNAPGEIARLTDIANPDTACILNVHGAHLQGLGDIEGVARAKAELFQHCGKETVLVVNGDDPRVVDAATNCEQRKIVFGCVGDNRKSFDIYATQTETGKKEDISFMLHIGAEKQKVHLQVAGSHNVSNGLAAAAISVAAGIDIQQIVDGLSNFIPTDRRMQIVNGPLGSRIINDTYNANPESMKAGIETLCGLGQETHIAVLGDMLELGPESAALHHRTGETIALAGVDFLGLIGDYAESTQAGAIAKGMDTNKVHICKTKDECLSWLKKLGNTGVIRPGTYILVKGSRGMQLDKLVERLNGEQ